MIGDSGSRPRCGDLRPHAKAFPPSLKRFGGESRGARRQDQNSPEPRRHCLDRLDTSCAGSNLHSPNPCWRRLKCREPVTVEARIVHTHGHCSTCEICETMREARPPSYRRGLSKARDSHIRIKSRATHPSAVDDVEAVTAWDFCVSSSPSQHNYFFPYFSSSSQNGPGQL